MVSIDRLWEHRVISSYFLFRDECLGAKQKQHCSRVAEWEVCVCVKPTYLYEFCKASFPGRGKTAADIRFVLWIAQRLSLNLKKTHILMFNSLCLVTSDQRSCICGMHWDTRLPMVFHNTKHTEGHRSIFISKHCRIYHWYSSCLKEIDMLGQKELSQKQISERKNFCEKLWFLKFHHLIRKCISKKTLENLFFSVLCFWYVFNTVALKLVEPKVNLERKRKQQTKRAPVLHFYL